MISNTRRVLDVSCLKYLVNKSKLTSKTDLFLANPPMFHFNFPCVCFENHEQTESWRGSGIFRSNDDDRC